MNGQLSLYIDDDRVVPAEFTHFARTSAEAIELLVEHRFTLISFDHDLGGDDTSQLVVRWMIATGVRAVEYRVHSANKIGRSWLDNAIADDLSRDDGPREPVGSSFEPIEPGRTQPEHE